MLWAIRWIWRRISDWYTLLDVFEWFGWKSAGTIMLASVVAAFGTFLDGAPAYIIFLAFLGCGLFVLGILTAWQLYKRKSVPHGDVKATPLKIEFDGESDVRWLDERHPTFSNDTVRRKFYGVRVINTWSKNIDNVSLEVEKIEQLPDRPGEMLPFPSHLGLKFLFKVNGKPIQDFAPDFSDRVPIISHVNAPLLSTIFKMASTQKHEFPHKNRRHRVHTKVTGSGVPSVSRTFLVWVDDSGIMKMVGE